MNSDHTGQFGFSLTEMVVAFAITTIATVAATSGWMFLVRGERVNSIQTELDVNVRTSMESLKHDLRLSSLDKIYYYPPGPGPYTAISFPMASDTNGDGLVETTLDGSNVLWTSTVIYHVWNGSPNELRKTVFSPRDNSLTPSQCQTQLASVVTTGDGSHTYGAANASTRAIFKNLFTWNVWGVNATYDGYSSTVERDMGVDFGSILLGPGSHYVKFRLIGKHPSSTGYKVGLDTLTASACGVEREGEAQIPPYAQSGATAVSEYMTQGSWSGNYHLGFPASTTGAYFTISVDNDRWEETNFRGQGAMCNRTVVGFDPTLSPKDYIVNLEGNPGYPWGSPPFPYAWTADNQTDTLAPFSTSDNSLTNCVIRVLLRGSAQAQNNNTIHYSGSFPYVFFFAASNASLRILSAYIAPAASPSNYTMSASASGTRLYFYGDSGKGSQTISSGSYAWASPLAPFETDANKSYLVTFQVDDSNGNALTWPELHAGAPGSYILPASANPTSADAQAADWSSKPYYQSANLYGVYGLYTTYPTNGLFTSQIFDTKIDTPVYSTVSWNSYCPSGSSISIKVRSGANADLSDAPAWSTITAFTTSPANLTCGNKRYIQFQAILNPDYWGWNGPELKNVTIKWTGATKIVSLGATMTKGPNYGIFEVTVDGNPLTKGLRIDLSIFETIAGWGANGKLITSSMTTEISPRNTGK